MMYSNRSLGLTTGQARGLRTGIARHSHSAGRSQKERDWAFGRGRLYNQPATAGHAQIVNRILLANDGIEPSQALPERTRSPGQKLRMAILADALTCVRLWLPGHRRSTRLREEALGWILQEDYDWPCSCANICLALGLEYSVLRSWALKERAKSTLSSQREGDDQ